MKRKRDVMIPIDNIFYIEDIFIYICTFLYYNKLSNLIKLNLLSSYHYHFIKTNNFKQLTINIPYKLSYRNLCTMLFNHQFKNLNFKTKIKI